MTFTERAPARCHATNRRPCSKDSDASAPTRYRGSRHEGSVQFLLAITCQDRDAVGVDTKPAARWQGNAEGCIGWGRWMKAIVGCKLLGDVLAVYVPAGPFTLDDIE